MSRFLLLSIIASVLAFLSLSCNSYSSTVADTERSRKEFQYFFRFKPTPDVINLYSYSNEVGLDASYWLSFQCNEATVKKIQENLQLQEEPSPSRGLFGGLNSTPTKWWDTTFIFNTKPYSRNEERLHWYLWYDPVKKRVYFLAFDT